ncbi:helix-turn-helix domain-containing protein [Streptomyces sp. 1222.5]|uniref:helix-turn-helix domain-containing protein n=1 Tax=Streptomyces sp. 1222.5 TaxID=1881026 RepID=UPI003D72AC44
MQGSVARQSHDSVETSHETPVIQLRPGLAEPSEPQVAEPVDVARRRAEALRLSREKMSLREIGERLGVSKDTARRDIKEALRDEEQAAAETSQETACDAGPVSHETPAADGETPKTPDGGGTDTLVLVLDEPLRQALAVLRATRGVADTPRQNVAVARAAIRSVADHIEEQLRP